MDIKSIIKSIGIIIVIAVTIFAFWYTLFRGNAAADPQNVNSATANTSKVVVYGEGVYYFPFVGADYTNALVRFKSDHNELRYVSATPDIYGSGMIRGYFVTFEPLKK